MLKTVFDHVINQIIALVENQIDEVQERNNRVKVKTIIKELFHPLTKMDRLFSWLVVSDRTGTCIND